jgi:hypothetical protein
MITAEQLEEWEAVCENASLGPWVVFEPDVDEPIADEDTLCYVDDADGNLVGERIETCDAEFVALAREAMPALIARVRELEAALARAERRHA